MILSYYSTYEEIQDVDLTKWIEEWVKQSPGDRRLCFDENFVHATGDCVGAESPVSGTPRLEYKHSSAKFYIEGEHGYYPITSYEEIQDVNLTKWIEEWGVKQSPGDRRLCCDENFVHATRDSVRAQSPVSGALRLEYKHSSAKFYVEREHGYYPITSYEEIQDIDLTKWIEEWG